jgi:predicted nucleic acid-binding protein
VSRALADTSIFIANEADRPFDRSALPDEIAVSIITIGELRAGVLAATDVTTRDRRLSTLLAALDLQPLLVDERTAEAWARLRIALRDSHQHMPVNDSWIAATALALDVPVMTQDTDYVDIPGLDVIHV